MSTNRYSMWAVLAQAYAFTFAHLPRIAVVSLPMFLVLGAITYVMVYTAPTYTTFLAADIPAARFAFLMHLAPYFLLSFVPVMILLTGLYRAYFNPSLRVPYVWSGILPLRSLWTGIVFTFFFALTGAVLLAIMLGLLFVLAIAVPLSTGLAFNDVLQFRTDTPFISALTLVLFLMVVILPGLFLLRTWVRYSVFLPHTVHERMVRVREAWRLTQGQVWRLTATYVLGFASFAVVTGAVMVILKSAFSLSAQESMVWLLSLSEGNLPAASPDRDFWPVLTAALLAQALAVLGWAFVVGLTGAAYDGLTGRLATVRVRPGNRL